MKNSRPLIIETRPTIINIEDVYPSKGVLIIQADNKFLIRNSKGAVIVGAFFGVIAFVFGLYGLIFIEGKISTENYIILYSLIIFGFLFTVYGLTVDKTKKKLILDRLNGIISYPDFFYLAPLKGNFNDLKAVISVSGDIDGMAGREYLKFANTFKPRKLDLLRTITYDNPYEEWSLFVWYMDKNRPLPPGTAFDEFRQRDFERRKAEGFPKPIFPSYVPTPEATPEQQAEREKIGGW